MIICTTRFVGKVMHSLNLSPQLKPFSSGMYDGDFVVNSYPLLDICVSKYIFETPGFKKTLRSR